jgi:hypothetical protein
MNARELLEQALEALEEVKDTHDCSLELKPTYTALLTDIREYLAQPKVKQEPVAATGKDLEIYQSIANNYFQPQDIPAGMVLVPKEPTEAMIAKVIDERMEALITGKEHTFIDIYKAMLTAAKGEK